MTAAAIWLVAGLLLAGAEMAAPGVFLLWTGLAALGTGAATAALDLSWHAQLGVFAGLTPLLIGLAAWRVRRRPQPDVVNAPGAGMIGLTCHALLVRDNEGRVSLRDGAWPARTTDGSAPAPGETLRVVGLEGTTVLVARPAPGYQGGPQPQG